MERKGKSPHGHSLLAASCVCLDSDTVCAWHALGLAELRASGPGCEFNWTRLSRSVELGRAALAISFSFYGDIDRISELRWASSARSVSHRRPCSGRWTVFTEQRASPCVCVCLKNDSRKRSVAEMHLCGQPGDLTWEGSPVRNPVTHAAQVWFKEPWTRSTVSRDGTGWERRCSCASPPTVSSGFVSESVSPRSNVSSAQSPAEFMCVSALCSQFWHCRRGRRGREPRRPAKSEWDSQCSPLLLFLVPVTPACMLCVVLPGGLCVPVVLWRVLSWTWPTRLDARLTSEGHWLHVCTPT